MRPTTAIETAPSSARQPITVQTSRWARRRAKRPAMLQRTVATRTSNTPRRRADFSPGTEASPHRFGVEEQNREIRAAGKWRAIAQKSDGAAPVRHYDERFEGRPSFGASMARKAPPLGRSWGTPVLRRATPTIPCAASAPLRAAASFWANLLICPPKRAQGIVKAARADRNAGASAPTPKTIGSRALVGMTRVPNAQSQTARAKPRFRS